MEMISLAKLRCYCDDISKKFYEVKLSVIIFTTASIDLQSLGMGFMHWSKSKGQKAARADLDPSVLSLFGLVKSLGPGAEPIRKGLSV